MSNGIRSITVYAPSAPPPLEEVHDPLQEAGFPFLVTLLCDDLQGRLEETIEGVAVTDALLAKDLVKRVDFLFNGPAQTVLTRAYDAPRMNSWERVSAPLKQALQAWVTKRQGKKSDSDWVWIANWIDLRWPEKIAPDLFKKRVVAPLKSNDQLLNHLVFLTAFFGLRLQHHLPLSDAPLLPALNHLFPHMSSRVGSPQWLHLHQGYSFGVTWARALRDALQQRRLTWKEGKEGIQAAFEVLWPTVSAKKMGLARGQKELLGVHLQHLWAKPSFYKAVRSFWRDLPTVLIAPVKAVSWGPILYGQLISHSADRKDRLLCDAVYESLMQASEEFTCFDEKEKVETFINAWFSREKNESPWEIKTANNLILQSLEENPTDVESFISVLQRKCALLQSKDLSLTSIGKMLVEQHLKGLFENKCRPLLLQCFEAREEDPSPWANRKVPMLSAAEKEEGFVKQLCDAIHRALAKQISDCTTPHIAKTCDRLLKISPALIRHTLKEIVRFSGGEKWLEASILLKKDVLAVLDEIAPQEKCSSLEMCQIRTWVLAGWPDDDDEDLADACETTLEAMAASAGPPLYVEGFVEPLKAWLQNERASLAEKPLDADLKNTLSALLDPEDDTAFAPLFLNGLLNWAQRYLQEKPPCGKDIRCYANYLFRRGSLITHLELSKECSEELQKICDSSGLEAVWNQALKSSSESSMKDSV